MAYEFYNPHQCAIDCIIRQPIGTIRVVPNECLPTPEQEEAGITADLLEQFNCPNLLHPTPHAVRRRLLQEAELDVPADVVAATSHLPEFGGPDIAKGEAPATIGTLPPLRPKATVKHVFPGSDGADPSRAPNLGEDLQSVADRMCSSGKCKNVETP